jgi:hypothetical protein
MVAPGFQTGKCVTFVCVWMCVDVCGCVWMCVDVCGCVCVCTHAKGFPLVRLADGWVGSFCCGGAAVKG